MSADSHADSDELDPDEPRTPMWLPLLGASLFLSALFVFLVTRSGDENGDGEAIAAEPAAAEPAAAEPEQPADTEEPKAPAPAPPAPPAAAQPGAGAPDKFQRNPGDEHYGHDHP